jgi:hypothetical protein
VSGETALCGVRPWMAYPAGRICLGRGSGEVKYCAMDVHVDGILACKCRRLRSRFGNSVPDDLASSHHPLLHRCSDLYG